MTRQFSFSRRLVAGLLAASVCSFAVLQPAMAQEKSSVQPVPLAPDDPAVVRFWQGEPREHDAQSPAKLELLEISDSVLAASGSLRLRVKITNTGSLPLGTVTIRLQRAPAVTTAATAQLALADDQSRYPVATTFVELAEEIAPGAAQEAQLDIPAAQLQVQPGNVYPVLLNVNGKIGDDIVSYLTSSRFLLRVAANQPVQQPAQVTQLGLVVPLTADLPIVAGETGAAPSREPLILANDDLAEAIGPQGFLGQTVSALTQQLQLQPQLAHATCLALDPALVDTVQRMTAGYQVGERRPDLSQPPQRLKDLWTSKNKNSVPLAAGSGAERAQDFLAQLKQLAQRTCVIALPWGNADLQAVAETKNQALWHTALTTEPIATVLGVDPLPVTLSPTGLVPEVSAGMPTPTRLLVAGNAVQHQDAAADTPVQLGQVSALGFDPVLSAAFAAEGNEPQTTVYSNPTVRYDYAVDTPAGRQLSALAQLQLELQHGGAKRLVVARVAAGVDASAMFAAVAQFYQQGLAAPLDAAGWLQAPAQSTAQAVSLTNQARVSTSETIRVTQQAAFIDDLLQFLLPDPRIALTPEVFVTPLRRELVRAFSVSRRYSVHSFSAAVEQTNNLISGNREMLAQLRAAVALNPPGNVYTRTSASSPLLIVARNGLPLPVRAKLISQGPDGTYIEGPQSVLIPAQGSITTQMFAEVPNTREQVSLQVWLGTQEGAAISWPVEIAVRTITPGVGSTRLLLGLLATLILALVVRIVLLRRKRLRTLAARPDQKIALPGPVPAATAPAAGERRAPTGQADAGTGSPRMPGSSD